jgi:hypothetical protein
MCTFDQHTLRSVRAYGKDVDAAVVAPPKIEERFSLGRQRPSRKHPNKTLPWRTTTPKDATVVDTDTIARKAFTRHFVQCRPDNEGKDEPQHRSRPSEARGRVLRLP